MLEGSDTMAPVVTLEDKIYKKAKKDAYDELYWELAKGVQNVKKGEVYTLEEAWEEIDKI